MIVAASPLEAGVLRFDGDVPNLNAATNHNVNASIAVVSPLESKVHLQQYIN